MQILFFKYIENAFLHQSIFNPNIDCREFFFQIDNFVFEGSKLFNSKRICCCSSVFLAVSSQFHTVKHKAAVMINYIAVSNSFWLSLSVIFSKKLHIRLQPLDSYDDKTWKKQLQYFFYNFRLCYTNRKKKKEIQILTETWFYWFF